MSISGGSTPDGPGSTSVSSDPPLHYEQILDELSKTSDVDSLLYGTALAREDGVVLFFDDIYGHDRKLEGLLGLPLLAASNDQRR